MPARHLPRTSSSAQPLRKLTGLAAGGFLAFALAVPGAFAQNASRGQSLYVQLGCGTSSCHGPNPADNLRSVLNGAGSAATIEYAANVRSEMTDLLSSFQTDASVTLDLAAYLAAVPPAPPLPPAPPPVLSIVEYLHAGFGHYFVTNLATEIASLDNGTFAGWARTGRAFNAYGAGNGVVVPVCRFFTVAFAPKSSHFYTPFVAECDGLRAQGSSDWQFEGEAFFVDAADAGGNCADGKRPVYRLYNNGQGGAPNHRYTTDSAVRSEMLAKGWISEGLGPQGVIFCAPQS